MSIAKTEWPIGELAEEFNITLRTLRFYEDRGILSPRRDGRNRVFDARDRANLIAVMKARELGFTLEEARDLVHEDGVLHLTPEQIVRQLVHLERTKTETEAAIAELRLAA